MTLLKKSYPPSATSLRDSVRGAAIDNIWPDYIHGHICVLLADGRVLAIRGTGVAAFKSLEVYEKHAEEILGDIREDEKDEPDTIQ